MPIGANTAPRQSRASANRQALRRPVRKPPQLLVLPERDWVERALRYSCGNPSVDVIALELERNESFVHGPVLELVVVVRFPPPDAAKRLTLRHVMPGGEPDVRGLVGGAEASGQSIAMRFRRYGGAWAARVVSDDF